MDMATRPSTQSLSMTYNPLPGFQSLLQSLRVPEPEASQVLNAWDRSSTASPHPSGDENERYNMSPGGSPSPPFPRLLEALPSAPPRRGCRSACRSRQAPTQKAQKERGHRNCLLREIVVMQDLITENLDPAIWAHWKVLNENNKNCGLKYRKSDILKTANQLFFQSFSNTRARWSVRAKL